MPLVRQELDIPLVSGLAQGQRQESLDPLAGFGTLDNTVQQRGGAYTKRSGDVALAASTATAAIGVHGHRNAVPLLLDGVNLYVYGGGAWATRGRAPNMAVQRTALTSSGVAGYVGNAPVKGAASPVLDTAAANGVVAVVYATLTGLMAACYDATTKAPLHGPVQLHALIGTLPYIASLQVEATVVGVGNTLVAVWRRIAWPAAVPEDCMWFSTLDTTNVSGGWTAPVQLIGAGVLSLLVTGLTTINVRPSVVGLSTRFVLAARDVAGTITVWSYTTAGVGTAVAQPLGVMQPLTYHVAGNETTVWLAGSQGILGGNVDLVAVDAATLAPSGAVMVGAWLEQKYAGQVELAELQGIVTTGAKSCLMVVGNRFENAAPPEMRQGYLGWRKYTIDGGGNVAPSTGASTAFNLHPFARPWASGGRLYVVATPYDTFNAPSSNDQFVRNWQKCLFVLDVTDARTLDGDVHPVANVAPRTCAANYGFQDDLWCKQMPTLASGAACLAVPILRSGAGVEDIELVEFAPQTSSTSAEVGGALVLSGGAAWSYDGSRPLEVGFLETPRVRQETPVAVGLTGSFGYTAVYEHVDAAGNTHQSAPAAPQIAVLANQKAVLSITTTNATHRQILGATADRVRIVVYRTLAAGSTYYRLVDLENNDPGNAAWQRGYTAWTDALPDVDLATRARLYTQPGTIGSSLPRVAPPALRYVVQHGDVVAGIGDTGRRIWFSAPRVDGEGTWFSDAMVVDVEDSSPLVALASLDGRLYAFSATGVHAIDGSGFAENGTGGYSLPQRLSADTGCIDARSVVATPAGVLFRSSAGIALLSRAGQVTLFGGAVLDTLAAYPTVQAVALDTANGRALFHCVSVGGAGIALVYDWLANTWTTATRYSTPSVKGACTIGDVVHVATSGATVYRGDAAYTDSTVWIGQTIETGWIKFTGLQGYQRIWRVLLRFVRKSPFGLRVSFAYDYDATYTSHTFTELQVQDAAGTLELAPARQRCQALRVKIEELEPAGLGTGQGLELTGIRVVWAKESRTPFARGAKR
jgi:hypothetical protein